MTNEQMVKYALEKGFKNAAVIDTDSIIFDFSFLKYCEDNLCGNYNANFSCPPHCGKPENMKATVMQHRKTLVLQSQWDISDFSDFRPIKDAKIWHNTTALQMAEKFAANGHCGLWVGASHCMLCQPCLLTEGKDCAHPDKAYSCMSAYCVHVKDLAEKCGMNYDFVPGKLSLFGMYVFD